MSTTPKQLVSPAASLGGPHMLAQPGVREQFIPLRKADLVDLLVRSDAVSAEDGRTFRRFCQLIQALTHHDFQSTLEELKDAYAPFDPDTDTRTMNDYSETELNQRRNTLFDRFNWLLERGNFTRLAEQQINHALADRSQWGLNVAVDFEIFDRLELYYRGDVVGTRFRRRLRNRFRPEAVDVEVYQRLVVIFHLHPVARYSDMLDTRDVYVKLFKDIPKADLEMLLPGTEVKMSLVDRAKILLPTLSGLSIAIWKIVQGALIAAAAGFFSSLAFLGLIGGTLGYGVRSFYGYLNTKQKYQLNLTQSLYYQNLDNNAGAIYRLLDEAEEQENREAMLAYFYLWRHARAEGSTAEELDRQIEALLRSETDQEVDFEVTDALAKLERLAIVESAGDRWRALPIDEAIESLERRWRSLA